MIQPFNPNGDSHEDDSLHNHNTSLLPEPPVANAPFRLIIKHGEYIYVQPDDILLIESCNHILKVYVATPAGVKIYFRHEPLKKFFALLPSKSFVRIGRFYGVNVQRISGGSYHKQYFEFDFRFPVHLTRHLQPSAFIGIAR